jgi:uncharacterized protein YbjT (DUF2867 family)
VIVVTGATGKVGRQVVMQLSERGAPVRAVTRDPGSAAMSPGVEVVRGDMADPASLVTEPEPVTPAVEQVTGAPARTFRQWAGDHISDFRPPSGARL